MRNQLEDIKGDLSYLRLREGFSHMRYEKVSYLGKFLGDTPSKPRSFRYIRQWLISMVYSLDDNEYIEVLLASYGLEGDYEGLKTLTKRRKKCSEKLNCDEALIPKLEELAISELAPKFTKVYYFGDPVPEHIPPIPMDGYTLAEIKDTLVIGELAVSSLSGS